MKTIILALLLAASLMACGGKSKKSTAPNSATGTTTETKSDGTGGSTYGGVQTPAPPTETPPAGQ
jgi:hypothetical protein